MRKSVIILLLISAISQGIIAQIFEKDSYKYSVISEIDKTVKISALDYRPSGDIRIPDEVNYNNTIYIVATIADSAFLYRSGLKSVIIPSTVTKIGSLAFGGCQSLTSIIIPESVEEIGNNAFGACIELCEIVLPSKVKKIERGTFFNCYKLSNISLSSGLKEIEHSAFAYCKSLETIELPEGLQILSGFYECEALKSITLPATLEKIDDGAFVGCIKLASITIPENVNHIGDFAFAGCKELTSIKIPSKVNYIGADIINECEQISSIQVEDKNKHFCAIDGVVFTKDIKRLITYPYSQNEYYKIPVGVVNILDYAFMGRRALKQIDIPETVNLIGRNAFAYSGLISVDIPKNVISIEKSTFEDCRNLTSATLPNGLINIGEKAFMYSNLTSIEIPEGVKRIGQGAFAVCENLETVILPTTLDSIGHGSFYYNVGITNIQVKKSIPPNIESKTFEEVNGNTVVLEVPLGSKNAYQIHPYWCQFRTIREVDFTSNLPTTEKEDIQFREDKGSLIVKTQYPAHIYIVNFEGKVFYNNYLSEGTHMINLPTSGYIVSVNGTTKKFLIR